MSDGRCSKEGAGLQQLRQLVHECAALLECRMRRAGPEKSRKHQPLVDLGGDDGGSRIPPGALGEPAIGTVGSWESRGTGMLANLPCQHVSWRVTELRSDGVVPEQAVYVVVVASDSRLPIGVTLCCCVVDEHEFVYEGSDGLEDQQADRHGFVEVDCEPHG